jgi:predicted Zn-ribbon and HTH transcriptional regulator
MTLKELHDLTAEAFDKMPAHEREAARALHDEHVKVWRAQCQNCGFKFIGALADLKGWDKCPGCGHGGK